MALASKNLPANAGDIRDVGLIPGLGRSPGGGHGNPLQYCCLENPRDRGAWQVAVHRVTKSNLARMHTYTCMCIHTYNSYIYHTVLLFIIKLVFMQHFAVYKHFHPHCLESRSHKILWGKQGTYYLKTGKISTLHKVTWFITILSLLSPLLPMTIILSQSKSHALPRLSS